MRLKQFQRVEVAAEFFFFGHKLVDGVVAVAAERDRLLHLLASEVLLKPLVAVTGAWNQMMLGRSFFGCSTAE